MSAMPIGLLLEAFVAVLLMVTIGYCFIVNKRLSLLRSNQSELREVIGQLETATKAAENAVIGLRSTADEADRNLSHNLERAKRLTAELGGLADLKSADAGLGRKTRATPPRRDDGPAFPMRRLS